MGHCECRTLSGLMQQGSSAAAHLAIIKQRMEKKKTPAAGGSDSKEVWVYLELTPKVVALRAGAP